jgi:hypothetical protein
VTERSNIDLHLFTGSSEEVEEFLRRYGIPFMRNLESIRHGTAFFEYRHLYLEDKGVLVACTVYPLQDIRRIPKSIITGKPMAWDNAKGVRKLIEDMASSSECTYAPATSLDSDDPNLLAPLLVM